MRRDLKGPPPRFVLVPLAIALIAALNLTVPYFALLPGPVHPIGDVLEIEGAQTYDHAGTFAFTTVRLAETQLGLALRGWIDPDIDVIERLRIVPPGSTDEEIDQRNTELMKRSQLTAATAALSLLGYDVGVEGGVLVEAVRPGLPAAAVLQAGDVILGVEGHPSCGTEDLAGAIDLAGAGEDVTLRVRRGEQVLDVGVGIVPEDDRPVIGVVISDVPGGVELPVTVRIESGDVGGPSAGLMFALAIVDRLEEEPLAAGRTVAGTGEITCSGLVGPVGGVAQKTVAAREAGADVFLVPSSELGSACERAGDMLVVGVDRLEEAVAAMRGDIPAGRTCA